jgi:hypothetical protein
VAPAGIWWSSAAREGGGVPRTSRLVGDSALGGGEMSAHWTTAARGGVLQLRWHVGDGGHQVVGMASEAVREDSLVDAVLLVVTVGVERVQRWPVM